MTGAGRVPAPSEAVLIKLAAIAAQLEELLARDSPVGKPRVGLNTVRNDRRRAMEAALVLLADSEVRAYLAELERFGLLPTKR